MIKTSLDEFLSKMTKLDPVEWPWYQSPEHGDMSEEDKYKELCREAKEKQYKLWCEFYGTEKITDSWYTILRKDDT